MRTTKYMIPMEKHSSDGTAAPKFHLSDTLDWSCYSARIKNQVIVVPVSVYKYSNKITPEDSTEKPFSK